MKFLFKKFDKILYLQVKGVEIGLVLLALVVWIIAIALFFHRWGKIRMLIPYQPDYKTQQSLKVPGTGTTMITNRTGNCDSQTHQDGPGCVQVNLLSCQTFFFFFNIITNRSMI